MQRTFLLGPTASGKTAIALRLAERLNAEIVSMDSMLVYRGMDLGTAKPTAEERAQVPHHLIDVVDPHEDFSVARWLDAANEVEAELAARGKHALYVGGTNLYLKARTAGLLESPVVPEDVRTAVRELAATEAGLKQLFEELQAQDPESAARIHPNDAQRIARAIEVNRVTGRALSAWQQEWRPGQLLGEAAVALEWPREVLRERVAQRFDLMLAQGFLDEIRHIRDAAGFGPTAGKALGYRQMLAYLEGETDLEHARERAITGTRTYIRRQMTWLRSFPDLQWVSMCEDDGRSRAADAVADECQQRLLASLSETTSRSSDHD